MTIGASGGAVTNLMDLNANFDQHWDFHPQEDIVC